MSSIIFKTNNPLELKQGTGFILTKNGIQSETITLDGSNESVIKLSTGKKLFLTR